jgi:hypothetical protein
MGKRKPQGELKSIPLAIQVHKYRDIQGLRNAISTHWGVDNLQPFFPSLELLFKIEQVDNVRDYGIKFDDEIQSVISPNQIITSSGHTRNIHIKQTMLVSPLKWMRGDFGSHIGLPTTSELGKEINDKIQLPHNGAYVGSLFASVFSQSKCIHFPTVYGVYTGIAKKHTINISDDYPDLVDRVWFSQNIGKTFDLRLADHLQTSAEFKHTRNARVAVQLGDEIELDGISELEGIEDAGIQMSEMKPLFENEDEMDTESTDSSNASTSYLFGIRSCKCEDEDADMTEELEEDDDFAWATMSNVPVQITVMEKCEGTLYELMSKETDSSKHIAWLTQILFALAFAQRTFGFVHNDLHSNNIMYTKSEKEFITYSLEGQIFKVPTYGYIIKLIDFERGIGSIRVAGMKQPKTFVSDHFSPNEEAGGQYNIDPFRVQSFETIKPNPSFDLVRLATSLFWDLFPEGPKFDDYKSNPIFHTLIAWTTQEDGTSVLFGKTEPEHDRYHGFHLYKAITRYCKDNAVPRRELQNIIKLFGTNQPATTIVDLVLP